MRNDGSSFIETRVKTGSDGQLELSLVLDTDGSTTLQAQVFEQVRTMILEGRLKPGKALPPSRLLAERAQVSRNTVVLAYDRLVDEGYIESRGTAGMFVSLVLPDDLMSISGRADGDKPNGVAKNGEADLLGFDGLPVGVMYPRHARPKYDFWLGRPDANGYPVRAWRRILVRKLAASGFSLTEYGEPAGLEELRVAIADHLGPARGMAVDHEQVIVTSGSQDGLNLICRLCNVTHRPVYIENPCYQGAAYLFKSLGHKLKPIPVDDHGLIVDKLPRDQGGIIYVTPSHQYPTGVTLSLERRMKLLKWAEETSSVIIEDDYDSDFRYDGPPLTSLAGLDRGHRVLYVGTFSKSLGAGLRLGYVVVPKCVSAAARNAKSQMNNGQPWLDQAVLAEFIETGAFDRHLRRMRLIYKARRDHLRTCLEKNFGVADLKGESGGLHVAWQPPPGSPPAHEIEQRAYKKGVGIYALNSGGAYDFDGTASDDVLVLGYSSLKETDIAEAIKRLHQAVGNPAPDSCKRAS